MSIEMRSSLESFDSMRASRMASLLIRLARMSSAWLKRHSLLGRHCIAASETGNSPASANQRIRQFIHGVTKLRCIASSSSFCNACTSFSSPTRAADQPCKGVMQQLPVKASSAMAGSVISSSDHPEKTATPNVNDQIHHCQIS